MAVQECELITAPDELDLETRKVGKPARILTNKEIDQFMAAGLKVGRAWAIREAADRPWEYTYLGAAMRYYRSWCFWATHGRLVPWYNTRHLHTRIGMVTP